MTTTAAVDKNVHSSHVAMFNIVTESTQGDIPRFLAVVIVK